MTTNVERAAKTVARNSTARIARPQGVADPCPDDPRRGHYNRGISFGTEGDVIIGEGTRPFYDSDDYLSSQTRKSICQPNHGPWRW